MKINNSKYFIKFISFIFLLLALTPIIDIEIFYIFIFIATIIIFSKIRNKIHYYKALFTIIFIIFLKFFQSNLNFNEGNNILILNDNSKLFYQNYLPKSMFSFLEKEYNFYYQNSTCDKEIFTCWKNFDPEVNLNNATPIYSNYAPSMSLDYKKNKYSRKLNKLNINNIKSARISEINNLRYNYFWLDKFDLVRENIPFFIMLEIPKFLQNSKICWNGNIFWEKNKSNFVHLKNHTYGCRVIEEEDINKKIYAVSLGKGVTNENLNYLYGDEYIKENDKLDKFLNKNKLIFKIEKKVSLIILDYLLIFLISFSIIFFINFIFKFNLKIYFYTFSSSVLFLLICFYSNQDLYNGFTILTGGNDGLVYNSYANNMFDHLKNLNIPGFLLGVEHVFYFPSSIRYFLAFFKIFFNETNYGYLSIGYFLCLILLVLFIKLFGTRYGIFFAFLIICTRLFEGYGASIVKMLKHINESDAEPFAITIFFLLLYIFIIIFENKNEKNKYLNFIFGFLCFITISLRPNFLPTVFLLFIFHIYFLSNSNRKQLTLYSLLGLSFLFLIPIHNFYFGKQIVLISSGYIHNTGASISTYINALIDIVNLNILDSDNLKRILNQIYRWIKPEELHYIVLFLSLSSAFFYKNFYLKIISSLALSQHAVLLVFEPRGRYAYLAWFLTIVVMLFIFKSIFNYLFLRNKIIRKEI